MNVVVHLITNEFPPVRGGLEAWTRLLACNIASAEIKVIVHVCGDQEASSLLPAPQYTLNSLAAQRGIWESALLNSNWAGERLLAERTRINFILLRNYIEDSRRSACDACHVTVSNFAVGVGYLAMRVSEALGIPHLPIVVGTDFSRGFRNPRERPILKEVCESAGVVAVKSDEQAQSLRQAFPGVEFQVIETSVTAEPLAPQRKLRPSRIRIFSDAGFSHKKGSDVLLKAFLQLVRSGRPVDSELCGSDEEGQEAYWQQRREEVKKLAPGRILFRGHVDAEDIRIALAERDVYCSASLGEGSSAARISALCAGIPIVATRCGELFSGFDSISHIRISSTGDADALICNLATLCDKLLEGSLLIDWEAVGEWRHRFEQKQEWKKWIGLIRRVSRRT